MEKLQESINGLILQDSFLSDSRIKNDGESRSQPPVAPKKLPGPELNEKQPSDTAILQRDVNSFSEKQQSGKAVSTGTFTFPVDSIIHFGNSRSIDISGLTMNPGNLKKGGIGYGTNGGARLMARAMKDIGNSSDHVVHNLPFCIEDGQMISIDDKVVSPNIVKQTIEKEIKEGFTFFNIPLLADGHASLISFKISDSCVEVICYDSLEDKEIKYRNRYNSKICDYLAKLLPFPLQVHSQPKFIHLLDQGPATSDGCGYYSLYTALLINNNPGIRTLDFVSQVIFDKHKDDEIRATMAVITMLSYGLDNINNEYLRRLKYYGQKNHVFDKLEEKIIELRDNLRGIELAGEKHDLFKEI